jgi:hypothetical protein
MKTIKIFTLAFAMIFANMATKAVQLAPDQAAIVKNTVNKFLAAFCHGETKEFSGLLDEDVKFTTTRGDKVISFTKSEMLESLSKVGKVQQNCKTDYSIVETLPHQVVVKVDMNYENFTKENYLTLMESEDGWKITQVSSSFK